MKSNFNDESDNLWDNKIKLKSLEDKRKKEEFLVLNEWDLPQLFKNPVISKQKMIEHVSNLKLLTFFIRYATMTIILMENK
jgi:hypothetical protein